MSSRAVSHGCDFACVFPNGYAKTLRSICLAASAAHGLLPTLPKRVTCFGSDLPSTNGRRRFRSTTQSTPRRAGRMLVGAGGVRSVARCESAGVLVVVAPAAAAAHRLRAAGGPDLVSGADDAGRDGCDRARGGCDRGAGAADDAVGDRASGRERSAGRRLREGCARVAIAERARRVVWRASSRPRSSARVEAGGPVSRFGCSTGLFTRRFPKRAISSHGPRSARSHWERQFPRSI